MYPTSIYLGEGPINTVLTKIVFDPSDREKEIAIEVNATDPMIEYKDNLFSSYLKNIGDDMLLMLCNF